MTTRMTVHAMESAAAAAKWWADRLRDGAGVGDNGATDIQNRMAKMMTLAIREGRITPEMCSRFERILRERLTAEIVPICDGAYAQDVPPNSGWDTDHPDIQLSVDYHPCHMLYDALIEAGVPKGVADMSALPLKTRMRVSPRRVLVAHGYGAKSSEIHGPVWGCTAAERRDYEDTRFDAFEKCCKQVWEADIAARYGEDWTYGQVWEAGEEEPNSWAWQGPV